MTRDTCWTSRPRRIVGVCGTSSPDVGGDENSAVACAELGHDLVALLLRHVAVHAGDGEVVLAHLVGEPLDLGLGVDEDDGLGDGEGVVEVAEGVELPLLLVDLDEELLDALQGELVPLDEDLDGVVHELVGHVEDLLREGGRHLRSISRTLLPRCSACWAGGSGRCRTPTT